MEKTQLCSTRGACCTAHHDECPVDSPLVFSPPCVGCSVLEQKVDRLTEVTSELARRLLKDEESGSVTDK